MPNNILMATQKKLTPSTINLVKAYGQDIMNRGIKWDQLIIFGSHAKGTAHKWSDIDVCVVSSEFSDNRFDNQRLLMHNRSQDFLDIEPHPFQPTELSATWDPLASEIRKHGITITTKN